MATPVGRDAWRELLDLLAAQRRRLAEYDDLHQPLTLPKPGATEEQLCAAEARLGYALDPHYREFLSVADGWDEYFISANLLGTADIGAGIRWERAMDTVDTLFSSSEGYIAEGLGIANDPSNCQSIGDDLNGYHNHLVLFIRDAPGCRAGNVVTVDVDVDVTDIRPDLYSFLTDELPRLTDWADRHSLGPHSEPWGRDLRVHPPTMGEIVTKIARLAEMGPHLDDLPPRRRRPVVLHSGATPAALDALEQGLGHRLHPEHRELLAVTDGMSLPDGRIDHILSVDDLRCGDRWREAISRIQESEDTKLRYQIEDHQRGHAPEPEPTAPVAVRLTIIPATPFGVSPFDLHGVDTRDGFVRNLLCDGIIPGLLGHTSADGPVREHLLSLCDALWWRAGEPTPEQQQAG